MNRLYFLFCAALLAIAVLPGCQPAATVSPDAGWITYEVREGLSYDEAWMIVVDAVLARDYQFEILAKDDGYIKTEFLHETVESMGVEVRTRVSIKFSYGRKTVRMKVDEDFVTGEKQAGADIPRIRDLKVELRDRLL
jgi:hypothetical protein